jgi:pyroglutamyl-peptidase
MKLLVTGFGPFGDFAENPSSVLAATSGSPFEVLEVSFRAVDAFLDQVSGDAPESLLCIGVAAKAEKIRFETVAHNKIGPTPDVCGEVWGPGPINAAAPPMHAGTLWNPMLLQETSLSEPSSDAGGYLCNYLYFQALSRLPQSRIGFLHVPSFEKIRDEVQVRFLGETLEHLELGVRA